MRIFKIAAISYLIIAILINLAFLRLLTKANAHELFQSSDTAANIKQLQSIKKRLINGEAAKMQELFPEGEFFSYALYGYSWVNVGMQTSSPDTARLASDEAMWAAQQLESNNVKQIFYNPNMSLDYGIFYEGWYTRLLAGIEEINASHNLQQNSQIEEKLIEHSHLIALALTNSDTPFLEAYKNQIWPCDTFVAISALSIAAKHLPNNNYRQIVTNWQNEVEQHLIDSGLELLPHKVDFASTKAIDNSRASSSSYILMF